MLPCDDGLFCTLTDTCNGGTCEGLGSPCPGQVCDEPNDRCVDCLVDGHCDDQNVCTDDACNSNLCDHSPNTLPCEDGQFCTSNDTCSNGECVGGVDPCPPLLCNEAFNACVVCLVDADCDDDDPCTTDVCNLVGDCEYYYNTAPCDDGVFCNGTETCSAGVCVSSGDPCTPALCDEDGDRCVECFAASDCDDDGVGCTDTQCIDGSCFNIPLDSRCDDGEFCNGPEFCHVVLDCQPSQNPCDDPNLCDEDNDSCGCREPVAVAVGSRFLAITPRPGETPVALLVTGVDIRTACVSLYVQPDGRLDTTPVYRTPGVGPDSWGSTYVRGVEIIPSAEYVVQTECNTGQGIDLSTMASATTWLWADANDTGFPVDFLDVSLVVDGFQGVFNLATIYATDLWGADANPCVPQLVIDFVDITMALDAFKQIPFPCDDPCP